MNYLFFLNNTIFFLSIRNEFLDMTVNNPIFIFSIITVIWFIPGILVRRFNEAKKKDIKIKAQNEYIKRLYPKND